MLFADPALSGWEWLGQWGPAVPLVLMLLWFADRWARRFELRLKEMRDASIRIEVHNAERHEEAMSVLRDIRDDVAEDDSSRRRRRRKPPDDETS